MKKRLMIVRIGVACLSFGLIATYVSCRAAEQKKVEAPLESDPGTVTTAVEPEPEERAVMSGSKSPFREVIPASKPAPKKKPVMSGSKSLILTPSEELDPPPAQQPSQPAPKK